MNLISIPTLILVIIVVFVLVVAAIVVFLGGAANILTDRDLGHQNDLEDEVKDLKKQVKHYKSSSNSSAHSN
jgi:uncharacterized membrane-anchored protein YhcB (DUF1043 family)